MKLGKFKFGGDAGKKFKIISVPHLTHEGESVRGLCDHPLKCPKPAIRVDSSLAGEQLLEVLIHEMIHATTWSLDEDHVHITAKEIAHALWKLGCRWQDE